MAIKKKDGKLFRLRGPNPIMKEQIYWDQFKLHNLIWETEVIKSKEEYLRPMSDFKIKQFNPVIETIKETEEHTNDNNIPKTNIYCLPIIYEKIEDELYGESRPVWKYGEKFIFEAIIVQQGDIIMTFWTNIEIEKESIIFPINKDKRWWKINKREDNNDGYLYQTIPSMSHPDFT